MSYLHSLYTLDKFDEVYPDLSIEDIRRKGHRHVVITANDGWELILTNDDFIRFIWNIPNDEKEYLMTLFWDFNIIDLIEK